MEWDKDYYVDGGVLDNYPIRLFDRKSFVNKEEHFTTTDTIDFENWLGKIEIMEHLSLFFKSPIGTDENALD